MPRFRDILRKENNLRLYIDPSTYCNAGCPQCDRTDHKNGGLRKFDWIPNRMWTPERIKRVYPPDLPVYEVFICGTYGDPFMVKGIEEMIYYFLAQYANPEIKNTTCQSPTRGLMLTDNAIDSVVAVITIAHAVVRGIAPATSGLSARPARRSRSTSTMSLLKPIAIWFRKTATTTTTACAGATPNAIASSNDSSVTANVGTGWLDRRRAPVTTIGPID